MIGCVARRITDSYLKFITNLIVFTHSSEHSVIYMASVTLKKEECKTFAVTEKCVTTQDNSNEEDILTLFNNLKAEENNLDEQKENLKSLLQQLEIKAKEEVEKQKRKVEKLNSEVSDLKRKCEKFSKISKMINSDSSLGRSQAGL